MDNTILKFHICFLIFKIVLLNSVDVWKDGVYLFNYSVDENAGTISFNLDVSTRGWIGLGLSNDGYMSNADLITGYIDDSGKAIIEDRFGKGHIIPDLDSTIGGTNDLTNISGSFSNERTKLSFSRKLISSDKYDYTIQKNQSTKVMFAYRKDGNLSNQNGLFLQHTNLEIQSLILYQSEPISTTKFNEVGTHTMMINFNNYQIPQEKTTTYVCQFFNIEQMLKTQMKTSELQDYHAVKFEAVKSHKVHHMIIYGCHNNVGYRDGIETCQMNCYSTIAISVYGSSPMEMPSEAGFIWGKNMTKYVYLQIHYDNPNMENLGNDNSGFRVYFTENLRPYNMGILTLGYPLQQISLPAGKNDIQLKDTCPDICSRRIGSSGFNIVFGILHGHLTMSYIRTEINYKDGRVDNSTFRNDNYDAYSQYFNYPAKPIHISPGDIMTTICGYNTNKRTSTTIGGGAANDEMCFTYFGYYPEGNGLIYCSGGLCESSSATPVVLVVSSNFLSKYWIINIFLMLYLI